MSSNIQNTINKLRQTMPEDQIIALLESLTLVRNDNMVTHVGTRVGNLREEKKEMEVKDEPMFTFQEPQLCEVKDIIDHDLTDGCWKFLIRFTDGTEEWVYDQDCDCEKTIKEYMERNNLVPTIYIFCRVSSKNQTGNNHVSLENQESSLLIEAKEKYGFYYRYKIIKIAETAYKRIPKALTKVVESATENDVILIYRVDRLSRNIELFLSVLRDLNERNVQVVSVEQGISYKDNRLDFIRRLLEANEESSLIGKRIKESYKYRKEQRNDESFGRVPFGKRRVEKDGRKVLEDDEKEQRIINHIINLPNIKMNTLISTANFLNSRGELNRGKRWTPSSLKRIYKK